VGPGMRASVEQHCDKWFCGNKPNEPATLGQNRGQDQAERHRKEKKASRGGGKKLSAKAMTIEVMSKRRQGLLGAQNRSS